MEQRKALQAILQCRTPAMGGLRYACSFGQTHHAFHSCNHRLCPQCGGADTAQWVEKQLGKLLPVPYFMVTFTLAEQLRAVMLGNRVAMELFFKCSSQALSELLADPKRAGENAVKYLGKYVQHSVISDSRVLSINGDQVSIRIKNRDTGAYEQRTMSGAEFIRRFLLHALPSRFRRIRYRGFLHARGKPKLQWLQLLLGARILKAKDQPKPAHTGYLCPRCGTPMQRTSRHARAPPAQRNEHFFNVVAA